MLDCYSEMDFFNLVFSKMHSSTQFIVNKLRPSKHLVIEHSADRVVVGQQ
jgi:hypothetical protein